jgi:deoxyribose-phosphate aldolase
MNDTLRITHALDLTDLQPNASSLNVLKAAKAVRDHNFASICVAPCNVQLALLHTPRVCAVIGFPHGNTLSEIKCLEARRVLDYGAFELDVVVNFGLFLDGRPEILKSELRTIVKEAHPYGVKVKAILETCYYTPEQIRIACDLCVAAGVDWVKTSTGFAGGATPEVVKIMLEAVGGLAQVKASGGIKTRADALMYLNLGCTRIGASHYKELL